MVSKRSSVIEGSLSVDGLNDILDELSKNMGKQYVIACILNYILFTKARELQSRILQRVYNRSTAEEQRWIVRIILKGLVESSRCIWTLIDM